MESTELLAWINANTDHSTYYDEELLRLMSLVKAVPDNGRIVEIGVYGGRTAAIYFNEEAHRNNLDIHLVDCWVLNESDARPNFEKVAAYFKMPFTPHWKPSQEAAGEIPAGIDLLHIDGDHATGAWDDCCYYLPKVKVGGVVVIHDYGKPEEYPEVTKAVEHYIDSKWERLGVTGSQFVARKLA